jgi:predicted secreted protein
MVNAALVGADLDWDRPQLTAADVYALSLQFGTSYEAALTQLAVLEKISWTAIRGLRLPPIQIKTNLAGRRPLDVRADLWVAYDRHREQEFPMRVGDELLVRLPEIPSSGFSWELTPPAPTNLEIVDNRVDAVGDGELVLGGAVQRTIHLRATVPGLVDLAAQLVRPWEDEPVDRVTFHVAVASSPTGGAPVGLLEKQQRRMAEVA